jgi:malonyl-CoA O-methyltransferase
VRHSFSQAAATYDQAAVLQRQVRDELLGRLDVLRMQPAAVVDLGAGTGQGTIALKRRYPGSRVVAMDLAPGMLRQARKRQTLLRRFDRVVADAAALPVGDATLDMIFSSLMLQWCNDPDRVLRECRRALRPGGVLHFTTLGPDTLVELRRSWQAADPSHAHVNRFIDMHDLGDALVRAGFAEPVLDVERYTLTYDDARQRTVARTHRQGDSGAHAGGLRRLPPRRQVAGHLRSGFCTGLVPHGTAADQGPAAYRNRRADQPDPAA